MRNHRFQHLCVGVGLSCNIFISVGLAAVNASIFTKQSLVLSSDIAVIIPDHTAKPSGIDDTDDWTIECNAPILASITLADINNDRSQDILVATYDVPPNPYWGGWLYIYDTNGDPLPGWPYQFNGPIPAAPAVGDVNGDGTAEIVAGTWNNLYVFDATANIIPGFPLSADVTQSPALWDLDDDGDLEIIVASGSSMRIYHHNGTQYPGWPQSASQSFTAPAIADLDGDNVPEIVAGTYVASGSATSEVYAWYINGQVVPGFPFQTSGSVKSPPAVGDVDGDGEPEIVLSAWNQSSGSQDPLYVLNTNGQLEPGFPISASYSRLSSPALADLDGDNQLEIIIGGMQTTPLYQPEVFVFRGDGTNFPGYPVVIDQPGGNINSSPIVADVDSDDNPEIIVKITDYIVAINPNGSILPGYPLFLDDSNHSGTTSPTPVVGDFDRDGDADLVAAACYSTIKFWDFPHAYNSESALWQQFRHDSLNTGNAAPDTVVSDVEDSPNSVTNGLTSSYDVYPNPTSGNINLHIPQGIRTPLHGILYNILGQQVAQSTVMPNPNGIINLNWKNSNFTPGTYFLQVNTGKINTVKRIVIQP